MATCEAEGDKDENMQPATQLLMCYIISELAFADFRSDYCCDCACGYGAYLNTCVLPPGSKSHDRACFRPIIDHADLISNKDELDSRALNESGEVGGSLPHRLFGFAVLRIEVTLSRQHTGPPGAFQLFKLSCV